MKEWIVCAKRRLQDLKFFQVDELDCHNPNQNKDSRYFIIETTNWVNVIPITKNDEVVMVRQFRAGSQKFSLEFPGGIIDDTDPEPTHAAARELEEETGFVPKSVESLGHTYSNPALLTNFCHVCLALDCEPSGKLAPDENEDLEVILVPLKNLPKMIRNHEIDHALMLTALQKLTALKPEFRKRIYGD